MLSSIVSHPIRAILIVLALMIAFGATPAATASVGHAISLTAARAVGVGVSLIPDAPKGFNQGLQAGRSASGKSNPGAAFGTSWSGGTADTWGGSGQAAPAQPNVAPAKQQAQPHVKTAAQKKAAHRKAVAKKRAAQKRAAERRARANTAPA